MTITNYIKERIETLRKEMFSWQADNDVNYLNSVIDRIAELQAVLSKMEELWK